MFGWVDDQFLNSSWQVQFTKILTKDTELKHGVHEADPVVNPLQLTSLCVCLGGGDS